MKVLNDKDTMVDTAVGEGIRKVEPDWTISQLSDDAFGEGISDKQGW